MIIENGVLIKVEEKDLVLLDDIESFRVNVNGTVTLKKDPLADNYGLNIPEGVSIIKKEALDEIRKNKVCGIHLPKSLQVIEAGAFKKFKFLQSIMIPEQVKRIEDDTFSDCENLTSIYLPEGIEEIGECAFLHCSKMQFINSERILNETALEGYRNLKKIGYGAFAGCEKLKKVLIPYSVADLGSCVFERCTGLESFGFQRDENGNLGITTIPFDLFSGCTNLKRIVIPEGIKKIEGGAFDSLKCTSIVLPKSLEIMASYAFGDNSSVYGIDMRTGFSSSNASSLPGVDYIDVKTRSVECIKEVIPRMLFKGHFKGYIIFASKEDANTVKEALIHEYQTEHYPYKKRREAEDLLEKSGLTIVESHKTLEGKDVEISYDGKRPTEIADGEYAINNSMETLTISGKITRIGKYAFADCEKLKSLDINNGVEEIKDGAFARCSKLERVTLPDTLKKLGKNVFKGCAKLKEITIQDGIETIDLGCFAGCEELESIIIPEGVKVIGQEAFKGCKKLQIVRVPQTLRKIGESAFEGCTEMLEIELGKTQSLSKDSFKGCTKLKTVKIERFNEEQENAFPGCKDLIINETRKNGSSYLINNARIERNDDLSDKTIVLNTTDADSKTVKTQVMLAVPESRVSKMVGGAKRTLAEIARAIKNRGKER